MWLAWILAASAHVPEVFITNDQEDWCAVIDAAAGGDYVLLEPGDYTGPCDVVSKVSDPPGEVTIVQSLDPTQPARIHHDGVSPYVLSLAGDVGLLLDLDFGEVPEGVVAVELREGSDLGVRNARFLGAGTAVRQVGSITNLGLRDCSFEGFTGVALDVGCDGACLPANVEISNNLVDGGAPTFRVHAGALDLCDNTALGATGTLFTLNVAEGTALRNTLEAEVVLASTGDLLVASNLVFGALEVAGGRVVGNTVVGEIRGDADVASNAVVGGAARRDDVACTAACFVDLEGRDLYPAEAGALVEGATASLEEDWCGRPRAGADAVGAFAFHGPDASPGPVGLQFKSRVDCRLPEGVEPVETDAGPTDPADTAAAEGAEARCGCSAEGGGGLGWWPWTVLRRPRSVR